MSSKVGKDARVETNYPKNEPAEIQAADTASNPLRAEDICSFPPRPTPAYNVKQREFARGVVFVTILILQFVGLTHGVALSAVNVFEKGSATWWTFLVLIYSEAFVALICLAGLGFADPGVVQRSPETCFPLPAEVVPWLKAVVSNPKRNEEEEEEGYPSPPEDHYLDHPDLNVSDLFCVRCLVWRKSEDDVKYYHCSVCQRCVGYYDHHCSVFGRCIAGTGTFKGNYKYFVAIIAAGILGYITTLVALVWSLSVKYGAAVVVPVSVCLLWLMNPKAAQIAANASQRFCRR